MAIRLTDDEEEITPNSNKSFFNKNNNSGGGNDEPSNNEESNERSKSSNWSASIQGGAAQNKGLIAVLILLVFGFLKFPKTTIFVLITAAVLFYLYGDQALLQSWGIK
jgi:hypothetical protein